MPATVTPAEESATAIRFTVEITGGSRVECLDALVRLMGHRSDRDCSAHFSPIPSQLSTGRDDATGALWVDNGEPHPSVRIQYAARFEEVK